MMVPCLTSMTVPKEPVAPGAVYTNSSAAMPATPRMGAAVMRGARAVELAALDALLAADEAWLVTELAAELALDEGLDTTELALDSTLDDAEPVDEAAELVNDDSPDAELNRVEKPVVVGNVLPPDVMVLSSAEVEIGMAAMTLTDGDDDDGVDSEGTPDWSTLRAEALEAGNEAVLTAPSNAVSKWCKYSGCSTRAVGGAVGNGGGGVLGRTGLAGAVADAVAKVDVGTVAGNVATLAAKLGLGYLDHVVEARLLAKQGQQPSESKQRANNAPHREPGSGRRPLQQAGRARRSWRSWRRQTDDGADESTDQGADASRRMDGWLADGDVDGWRCWLRK